MVSRLEQGYCDLNEQLEKPLQAALGICLMGKSFETHKTSRHVLQQKFHDFSYVTIDFSQRKNIFLEK